MKDFYPAFQLTVFMADSLMLKGEKICKLSASFDAAEIKQQNDVRKFL